jgi:hypothetical protein
MFFFFLVAVLDLAIGFGLAVYLGGHYRTIRKFGLPIPLPFKTASPGAIASPKAPPQKGKKPESADEA